MADTNQASGVEGRRGATHEDQGNLNGPDSPAGDGAGNRAAEEGQGDDLTDQLGGAEGIGVATSGDREREEEAQDGR